MSYTSKCVLSKTYPHVLFIIGFAIKKMNSQEELRKHKFHFYEKNRDNPNKFTLDHSLSERVTRSTIYNAINCVKSENY